MISNPSTSLVTNDSMGNLDFTAGTADTTNARVSGLVVGTSEAGGSLAFETRADGGSLTEKARILSTGGLLVGATTTASSISNTAPLVGGRIYSFYGEETTLTSGTARTLFTLTADYATYIVSCSGIVSSVLYSETAIVMINNTSVSTTVIADGAVCSISNSGLDVQYTQSSGVTMSTVSWSATRIL
jgi:hypothetical protein